MDFNLRSLLLAAIVLSNVTWTLSWHQYKHNVSRHRIRHRRQGARLHLPASFVLPGGEGYGAWGPWGEPSGCSRTCGGGVATQKRICLEIEPDGRQRCVGGDTKYYSCNTQDCPPGSKDFRSEQCAEFDSKTFKGIRYNWVPYTKAPNPCELNCMPHGERFYYRQSEKVVDGTRCNDDSFDVCVNGICQPVGCDMMLGSNAQEDKCRECRGNGSNCHTNKGIIDTQELRQGYNDILLIPEGATTIIISEVGPSSNYLAIRNKQNGSYYVNGNYRIDFPRSLVFAGALWHYERSQQGLPSPDKFRSLGPTTEPLYLSLLFLQEINVGIEYEYSIPTALVRPPNEQYNWVHEEFTPCSATCGGGYQTREVTCRSREALEVVDESLCDVILRPESNQSCAREPCAPRWVEGPWSPCSTPCGEGGTQSRQVYCEKVISEGRPSVVSDDECYKLLGPQPALHQKCNENASCPSWFTGPWKSCDKLCGEGKQTRQVVCRQKVNGRVEVFPDEQCKEQKPQSEQACILHLCEGVDWVLTEYTGCESCLSNLRTRSAFCATKDRKIVNDSFCAYHPLPVLQTDCHGTDKPKCEAMWYASQWGKCSVKCGKGVKTRRVFCGLFDGSSVTEVEDGECDATTKYDTSLPCEEPMENCPANWFSGPWSECTKKCGGGERYRKTMCLSSAEVTPPTLCDGLTVPDSVQSCNEFPCDEDETIPVDASSTTIMDDDDVDYCDEMEEDYPEAGAEEASESSDITDIDDMMFSDSPSTWEEGSGTGSTFSEIESEFTTESGSGTEPLFSSDLTTEFSGSGPTDESTVTESSISTDTGSTESSSSEDTSSTESSSLLDTASTESSVSAGSELTETSIDGSTESTGTDDTESTVTGDTPTESSTLVDTGSTETSILEETGATESTGSSETTVSGETSESSETTEEGTTESSSSTASSSDETTSESSTSESSTSESSTSESSTSDSNTSESSTSESSTSESSTSESSTSEMTSDSSTLESSTSESSTSEMTLESSSSEPSTTESSTLLLGSSEFSTSESGATESSSESSTIESSSSESSESSTLESSSSELSTTESSTVSGSTEETSESSTGTTESGGTDVSTLSSETGSTEITGTGSTDTESTEVSGSTESTSEGSSTTEESTPTGLSEGSTPWDWSSTIEEYTKRPRCKPRARAKCSSSKFGCCPDNRTSAAGPFDEGCIVAVTCAQTKHGCCPDGVTAAIGPKHGGCPKTACADTLFGCCKSDNKTEAQGNDDEGCPPPPPKCKSSKYGCCKDGTTEAKGPKKKGCPETEVPTTKKPEAAAKGCKESKYGCCHDNATEAAGPNGQGCPCSTTEFGCCPDDVTPAQGPTMEGCVMSCNTSAYGCCVDGTTPAHGPDYEGCCLLYRFGCCPDNFKPAEGPRLEGCDCQSARYGCCPDNVTVARGPQNEGCGCQYSQHGCCPDRHTQASGADYEGCPCSTYQFGCCPDGKTIAKGPNAQGCSCTESPHGCCGDGETAAQGPNLAGCDCSTSKYGCCPDGRTEAQGEKFLGCMDAPESRQEFCSLPRDRGGPCNNYTVFWYYDMEYGGCSRFWYGGCDGNGNRFASLAECEDVCVHPKPKDSCKLPKVKGVCDGYNLRWYYEAARGLCGQFVYGGCLGNGNNFETREACKAQCEPPSKEDQCNAPIDAGSCAGNFPRWAFNQETRRCESFAWGGCEGNANRFTSEEACVHRCDPPGAMKAECLLAQDEGNCTEKLARWAFSQPENRCVPFYYTGCHGNGNRFDDQRQCSDQCPSVYIPDICTLPAATGECSNYKERWYYDTSNKRCRQFYYGGCAGNGNNFATEPECKSRCSDATAITTTTTTSRPQTTEPFRQEHCFLEADRGPCDGSETHWAYNAASGDCRPFSYGGCGGNRNNFPTLEHCQYYCSPSLDLCQLPMSSGPCDNSQMRWFYDASTDSCSQFSYGGCQGNDNRFETRDDCERRCRSGPQAQPTTAATTAVAIPEEVPPECEVPSTLEECTRPGEVWYYSRSTRQCTLHDNSGIGLNCRYSNVYQSEEECERRCGVFRDLDVCRYPVDPGQCHAQIPKVYWDSASGRCVPFTYGGCLGGPNRFSSIPECENTCAPSTAVNPCTQQVDAGSCSGYHIKWFFDPNRQDCNRFVYGGCEGNGNRFDTQEECESRCKSLPSTTTILPTPVTAPPQELEQECRPPTSLEPCGRNITAYYYDSARRECSEAPIGDCSYMNRYSSEEECERRCGLFRGIDVCAYGLDPGPCRSAVPKVYWDSSAGRCQPYTYGGCHGSPNRFSTVDECQAVCGPVAPGAQCTLEVETGDCPGPSTRRWYYSDAYADCLPFVYTGCGGNANNFRTAQECVAACKRSNNETNEVIPNCDRYKEECSRLTCDYGTQRTSTQDGCERCVCSDDPCASTACSSDQRCVITPHRDALTGQPRYEAECRMVNKPGECPHDPSASSEERARVECSDDADCRGAFKCCARGDSRLCVRPQPATIAPTQYTRPQPINPSEPRAPASDPATEPEVHATEGSAATLQCLFHGNPPPRITWHRGEVLIDGSSGRYRILSDGALEIVSLYRNDSGVYICVAENSLGIARQEIWLHVNDPIDSPAAIAGDQQAYVTGDLGKGIAVRCLAYGHPAPEITWYRGERGPMVPFISQQYEARGNVLKIRALDLESLGEYACHAYNGYGTPATWRVIVRAYRPHGYYGDNPYLVARDGEYTTHEALTAPPTEPQPPPPEPEVPVFTAPVVTRIVSEGNSLTEGSEMSLLCEVDGYPPPNVVWSKDGVQLTPGGRVQISEAHRLTISGLGANDAGQYTCYATNDFSSHQDTVNITVEGLYIPASCTDNPFFANCKLIVRSKFCRHVYYSNFCCRSCMEAGQLRADEVPAASIAAWRRK